MRDPRTTRPDVGGRDIVLVGHSATADVEHRPKDLVTAYGSGGSLTKPWTVRTSRPSEGPNLSSRRRIPCVISSLEFRFPEWR
jgi:hypothetical protein